MRSASSIQSWVLDNAGDLQVVLFFSVFGVLGMAELIAPARPGCLRLSRRWAANLVLTGINVAVMSLLPVTFFGASVWAARQGWGVLNFLALPSFLILPAGLLLRGFISFFTHWLMHRVPWLWRIHRVHHLDTEMDVSTTVRFHPLEFLAALVPGIPLVVAFGLPPWVLLFYELLDAVITVWSHANVRLPHRLEVALRYVIVTPDLHRVHHSARQPETDSNFGAVFPVWDVLFRTFRTETREPQDRMMLGLQEVRDARCTSPGWLLASPVMTLARSMDGAGSASRATGWISRVRKVLWHMRPPRVAITLSALAAGGVRLLPQWRIPMGGNHLAGLVVSGIGLAVMLTGWWQFRRRKNPVCHASRPVALVTTGLYRVVRNPMYLGLVMAVFGGFVATGHFAFLVAGIALWVFLRFVILPEEERRTARALGDPWREYVRRVLRGL